MPFVCSSSWVLRVHPENISDFPSTVAVDHGSTGLLHEIVMPTSMFTTVLALTFVPPLGLVAGFQN